MQKIGEDVEAIEEAICYRQQQAILRNLCGIYLAFNTSDARTDEVGAGEVFANALAAKTSDHEDAFTVTCRCAITITSVCTYRTIASYCILLVSYFSCIIEFDLPI